MRPLKSFTVKAQLPPPIAPLWELATNLRWSWDQRTRDLFRWVDAEIWVRSGGNPVKLLQEVSPQRLAQLAEDPAFVGFLGEVYAEAARELSGNMWFQGRQRTPLKLVAYLSPEFGISEALPQYSGGLGVLAGDHLKASAGLGVPLVGVGLLYRHGYFHQLLDQSGWQTEAYPDLCFESLPIEGPLDAQVTVDLGGTVLAVRIWRVRVSRVVLYLLDTDFDANEDPLRSVTDRLYGGDIEHRLIQEITLGIGGVRALRALGHDPDVYHTNEGHAGFQGLERIRMLVQEEGLAFSEALEVVRASTVFTTHTPVPAGIDRFPTELMAKYLGALAEQCGISFEQFMELGHFPGDEESAPFNMAVMGLRLASAANGVSRLHGEVSRSMFAHLWPALDPTEVPISHVTNGVHARTWTSPDMDELLNRALVPGWPEAGPDVWNRVDEIPDDLLWRAKEEGRRRLVRMVRRRLRLALQEAGAPEAELAWCEEVLDPDVLTVGFARRFTEYKRAGLLLSDPDRLRSLIVSAQKPVQFVFAGKAHPNDSAGKEMIRRIVEFSRDPAICRRFVFVPDYDMAVARSLYRGADLWLNTPRRPLEACGTSGMKAVLNGAINCSVRDGWWDEMYDGTNGWAIASAEHQANEEARDRTEAANLFSLLEREIIPLFYDRDQAGLPHGWIRKMKDSLRTLGPRVSAARMVREYVTDYYEPAARRHRELAVAGFAGAKSLAGWKRHVFEQWPAVSVREIGGKGGELELGTKVHVEAAVELGKLSPSDVVVQLLHGPLNSSGELVSPQVVKMQAVPSRLGQKSEVRYRGEFDCTRAGRYGYAIRVIPYHPYLANSLEMGLACWAESP
jgi:starch phosphorylase